MSSHASWMRLIVLSRLRRRVLGDVIVVPRLACRPCPRRNGVEPALGDVGESGEPGVAGATGAGRSVDIGVGPLAMTCSSAAVTPLGETGGTVSSAGVVGCELMRPLPSSDSGS